MILPILVILLISIAGYITLQRQLDRNSQIVVVLVAVLVLYLALNNLKVREGFTNSNSELEDKAPVIELNSPSYDEINEENNDSEDSDYQKQEVADELSTRNNSINDNNEFDRILQHNFMKEEKLNINKKPIKVSKFQDVESRKKNGEGFGISIEQAGMKGTGNIFTPQIIIKTDKKNGISENTKYQNQTTEIKEIEDLQWDTYQTPESDLWNSNNDSSNDSSNGPLNVGLNLFEKAQAAAIETYNKYLSGNINRNNTDMPFAGDNDLVQSEHQEKKQPSIINRKINKKDFFPGYSIIPPNKWDIPQKRPKNCIPDKWSKRPSAVFDRGTPLNVLELDSQGRMKIDENDVTFTNVGSILPKFKFEEYLNY